MRKTDTIRGWIVMAWFVPALLTACKFVPGAASYFEIHYLEAILALMPMLVVGFAFAATLALPTVTSIRLGAIVFVALLAIQTYAAMLMNFVTARSAPVFALAFVFTASYHGLYTRSGVGTRFAQLATFMAMLIAVALAPSSEHRSVIFFASAISTFFSYHLANSSVESDRIRKNADDLRLALHAQTLAAKDSELRSLHESLLDFLGTGHDLNNLLMTARLNAEDVAARTDDSSENVDDSSGHMTRSAAEAIVEALEQAESLTALLKSGRGADALRRANGQMNKPNSSVSSTRLQPSLESAVRRVTLRYPTVQFRLDVHPTHEVFLVDGQTSWDRIVDNLLLNACEGNGRSGATHVEVTSSLDPLTQTIQIDFVDDGPGFSPQQLNKEIRSFETTKALGTGIGLFTTEKLVQASGGTILRSNRENAKGARLAITLHAGASQLLASEPRTQASGWVS